MKPFAPATERNRAPILACLRRWFMQPGCVLEIGAGTGQHAAYLASELPHLVWIATDRAAHHTGIRAWIEDAKLPNLQGPLELDVLQQQWPVTSADYVFSANTAHIMSWPAVLAMFAGVGHTLRTGGYFALYGPFNRDGRFTSDSNAAFDAQLRQQDAAMGIRDDRALIEVAAKCGLTLVQDESMPANNRMLLWQSARELKIN